MIKTYNIELEMSEELYEHWKGVLESSRSMYNDMSEILWEHRNEKLSITNVHHWTYNPMREKYPEIPAQAVIKTYKGLLSNYRANKKRFKCEKKQLSMNLDKRLYSRLTPTSIDLSGAVARKRRTTVKFKMYGKFQELASQFPMKDPSIFMRDGRLFLGVPFEIPVKPVVEESCLGVDLGIKRFFTTSDGVAIKTTKLNALKRRIRHNKRVLQSKKKNSHSARTKLKKLSHRERNINKEYTHQLVNELLKTDKTVIVLENLTGLKEKTSKNKEGFKRKKHNNMVSQVPFYMFRDILTYKALLVGKRVATVSPTYTSQTDCLTGKRDGTRQGTRYYSVSGKVYDADWNAAINIVNRYKHSESFIEPICGTLNFIRQGVVNLPMVCPQTGKPRVL